MAWFTATRRRWLYDSGTAATLLLGTFGVMSGDKADAINYALALVLQVARRNVNDDEPADEA